MKAVTQISPSVVRTSILSLFVTNEYKNAEIIAKRKLARIIEREGDAGGERRKPYYLEQLIAEAIDEMNFSAYTQEVHRIAIEKKEKPTVETAGNP